MADQKSFSQYLAEAQAQIGQTAPLAAPQSYKINSLGPKKPGDQDALSWFIDILSRPMRAVQNPVNQAMNEAQKIIDAEKTGQSYDVLGGIGNVLTAGPRGFFSQNPEDQPAGNQLIEKGTDVIGQVNDPNYKNVEDNVNPWVKGIGGFALDVGLDPLTYVPGAVFAKIGSGIAKGVKGAATGASAAVAGTRLGKVAEAALEKADVVAQATAAAEKAGSAANADRLIDSAGYMMAKAYNPGPAIDLAPAPAKPGAKPRGKKINPTQAAAEATATTAKITNDAIENATEAAKMATAGERVPLFSENLAAKGDAIEPLRFFSEAIQANKVALETPITEKALDWMRGKRAQANKDPNFVINIPQTADHARAVWNAQFLKELPERLRRLRAEGTEDSLSNASKLEKLWLTAFKAEVKQPDSMADILANFKAANPAYKAELTAVIGPKAYEQLSKMNENTFLKATEFLADALNGKVELANPAKMTTSPEKFVREVMAHNEVEIPSLKSVQNRSESIVGTPEAAAIDVAVEAGKKLDEVPNLSDIPEENIRLLMKTLTTFLKEFLKVDGYEFRSNSDVWRTAEELWAGLGKRPYELNGMDQMTLFKETVRDLLDEMKAVGYKVSGYQRGNTIYSEMMGRLRDVTKWFDQRGITMYIGVGDTKVPLDTAQLLTILSDASKPGVQNVIQMAVANVDTLIPMTNIQNATIKNLADEGASIDDLVGELRKAVRVSEGAEAPPNALNAPAGSKRKFGHYPTYPKNLEAQVKNSKGLLSLVESGKINKATKKPTYYLMVDTDKLAVEVATLIKNSRDKLLTQVDENLKAALKREVGETHDISVAQLADLLAFVDDPLKLADSIRALGDLKTSIIKKGSRARATKQAQKNAIDIVTPAVNPEAVTTSKQMLKAESTLRTTDDASLPVAKRQAKTRKAAVANSAKNIEADAKAAKESLDEAKDAADGFGADGTIVDKVAYAEALGSHILNANIARTLNPLQRIFNAGANAERTLPRLLAAKPTWAMGRASYMLSLRNIAAAHKGLVPGTDTTYITQAWRNIAMGNRADPAISPEIAAAENDLLPAIQQVFGLTNKNAALESLFLRAGGTEIDMLAYLKKADVEFNFDLDLATRMVDDGQSGSLTEAIIAQWGRVFADEDRPLELLEKVHYAGSLMVLDKAVASSLLLVDGVTSTVPKKGYGLVPEDLDPLQHPFFAHIPAGTYIDAQYMTEIKRIEEFAMEARTFSGPFGTWVNQTYTPLLNVWKKGVTIYRPGHHVRNFSSSESIQWLTEGNKYFTKSFGAAARVLAAHRSYKDIDWVEVLQSYGKEIAKEGPGVTKMPTAGEVLFNSPKWGDVTTGRLYEAAQREGLFAEFKQAEDILDEMTSPGAVQKFSSVVGLEGTKAEDLARGVSEGQAHFNRLHHFTQILMKQTKSGKNFDDAVREAAWKVKRHHPDSSMLASGEAKLRAIIPFYTWFRLTMPVLMQGIATQPGRFLVFPKAYYNGAIAMGVDPYSMSDPFPQDQLFPGFLRDQINGPVGEFNGDYYGINPGIAYLDILNQFAPDPLRGALGMTTPLVKVPLELIGGTQWQTGAKIKDISDYVDSSLPGINYLANLTGYSTTGSIYGTLTGTGLDQQLAVSRGDKTDTDKGVSLINWLTGLGVQNMSRQSYIDYAEIEKRNKAARDAAEEEGTARSPF